MDMNEATSKALAAERSAAHLTIKELAEKSGVPERTLIRVLKNERNINVIQVAQLANALGVYPHEIIESAERFVERAERGPVVLPDAEPVALAYDSHRQLDECEDAYREARGIEDIDIDSWANQIKAEDRIRK